MGTATRGVFTATTNADRTYLLGETCLARRGAIFDCGGRYFERGRTRYILVTMNSKSLWSFLPRHRRTLGLGFPDVLALAKKSKPFHDQSDSSWQDLFLPNPLLPKERKQLSPWVAAGLGLGVLLVTTGLMGRLWWLQVAHGQENLQASDGNRVRILTLPAPRGVIYDRNGLVLATNVPGFRLVVSTAGVTPGRRQQLADFLGGLIGQPAAQVLGLLSQADQPEVTVSSGLSRDQALSWGVKIQGWPEVRIAEEPIRSYPNGVTLAHLLGYLGEVSPRELAQPSSYSSGDKIGRTGVEAAYDYLLRGRDGRELVEVDSVGKVTRVVAREEPVSGHNLVLTVDLKLSQSLQTELISALAKVKTDKGAVVALNPQDGSLLSYISWPSFDPNLFSQGLTQSQYASLANDPAKPLFDRVISGTYSPGSTFKPTVATAALSEGVTTRDRLVYSPGVIYLGTQAFHNWRPSGFGDQNIIDAIAYSNDVYFYTMGGELGVDRLSTWAKRLGFGEPTGIKIPGEEKGNVPTKDWKESQFGEPWYPGDNYNLGIGQGYLQVNLLQLAGSIEAVSNGGKLYQPIFIKEVRDSGNLVISRDNPVLRRDNLIEAAVDSTVKDGMKKACTIFVNLSGDDGCKTGTAEFGFESTNALFVAFAPWEKPQIVVATLLEGGGIGVTASYVARPALAPYLK